jgi:hypothetical protein
VPSNSRTENITLEEEGTTILRNAGNDRTSDKAAAAADHLHPQQRAVETSNLTEFIKFTILAKLCLFLSADSVVAVTWTS